MQKFIIQWHITHLCNLRCTHCYQEEYNRHMLKENFHLILNKLKEFFKDTDLIKQINLTGGEPLCHPNFFEFATEIKNQGYKLGILTNGTLIDEDIALKIKQLQPNKMQKKKVFRMVLFKVVICPDA